VENGNRVRGRRKERKTGKADGFLSSGTELEWKETDEERQRKAEFTRNQTEIGNGYAVQPPIN